MNELELFAGAGGGILGSGLLGHTGLKPLGTVRFQEFVQQHGESFTDDEEAA